jgi:CheY-like chemotaxis protein
MTKFSAWEISAEGKLTRQGWPNYNYPFRILYLDDHRLIRNGVKDFCINPFFPSAKVFEIEDGHLALNKAKELIDSNTNLDLIITDINHPGLRGDLFISEVRKYEKSLNREKRVPILVISMVSVEDIRRLLIHNKEMADIILTKASEGYEIAESIEKLLFKNQDNTFYSG